MSSADVRRGRSPAAGTGLPSAAGRARSPAPRSAADAAAPVRGRTAPTAPSTLRQRKKSASRKAPPSLVASKKTRNKAAAIIKVLQEKQIVAEQASSAEAAAAAADAVAKAAAEVKKANKEASDAAAAAAAAGAAGAAGAASGGAGKSPEALQHEKAAVAILDVGQRGTFDFARHFDTDAGQSRLLILKIVDTIHDFWNGYRLKKDAVAAAEIKRVLLQLFRELLEVPAGELDSPSRDVILLLEAKLRATGVEAADYPKISLLISDIEDTLRTFFYDFTEFLARPDPKNGTLSHTQIYEGYDRTIDMDTIRQYDTFIITPGTKRVKTFTVEERAKVGNFIIHYFFGTKDTNIEFTCDTSPAKIGVIFKDFENAFVVTTPMNIADSAVSSLTAQIGKGKPLFIFPSSNPRDPNTFVSRRTDNPDVTISYTNENFCEKKPYGFTYNIASGGVGQPFRFNSDYRQGASLNYLIAATLYMNNLEGAPPSTPSIQSTLRSIPSQSGCMRFDNMAPALIEQLKVSNNFIKLWKNIKRLGDQDQTDAAYYLFNQGHNIVLVTIDRLCFLLAQLLGIPCILHNKDTAILSKNRQAFKALTAAEIAEFIANRTRKFVEAYGTLYTTLASSIDFLAGFRESIKIEALVAFWKSAEAEAATFRTLLRARIQNITEYLDIILTALRPADPWLSSDRFLELPDARKEEEIRRMFSSFSAVKIDSSKLIEIMDFIKKTMPEGKPFQLDVEYPIFNFDITTFDDLLSAYKVMVFEINRVVRRDRYFCFSDVLQEYNKLVNEICDSFHTLAAEVTPGEVQQARFIMPNVTKMLSQAEIFTGALAANPTRPSFEGSLDILEFNKKSVILYENAQLARTNNKSSAPAAVKAISDRIEETRVVAADVFARAQEFLKAQIVACIPRPADVAEGSPCFQTGGAIDPVALTNIAEIFSAICKEAAAVVNNIFSELYPGYLKIWSILNLIRIFESDANTAQNISDAMHLIDSLKSFDLDDDTDYANRYIIPELALEVYDESFEEVKNRVIDQLKKGISKIDLPEVRIPDFMAELQKRNLVELLRNLNYKFNVEFQKILDAGLAVDDRSVDMIKTILNPYFEDAERSELFLNELKLNHPFNEYNPVVAGADGIITSPPQYVGRTREAIMATVIPASLLILTFMNDIIGNDVEWDTSFFSQMFLASRALPVAAKDFDIYDPLHFRKLHDLLRNIGLVIANPVRKITYATLDLSLSGGARKTLKKRKVRMNMTRKAHRATSQTRRRGTHKKVIKRRKTRRI